VKAKCNLKTAAFGLQAVVEGTLGVEALDAWAVDTLDPHHTSHILHLIKNIFFYLIQALKWNMS